jgi:hypothetical protein
MMVAGRAVVVPTLSDRVDLDGLDADLIWVPRATLVAKPAARGTTARRYTARGGYIQITRGDSGSPRAHQAYQWPFGERTFLTQRVLTVAVFKIGWLTIDEYAREVLTEGAEVHLPQQESKFRRITVESLYEHAVDRLRNQVEALAGTKTWTGFR